MIFDLDRSVWQTALGAAKSLDVAYADSSLLPWFGPYQDATSVLFDFLLAGLVPTSVEFRLLWSTDGGTYTKGPLGAVIDVTGAVQELADGSFKLTSVANGHHTACIAVPCGVAFKLQMKRTDGDATSTCLAKAVVGNSVGGAVLGSAGSGDGAVFPTVLAGPTSIIDDGGAPVGPVAITVNYVYNDSAWIDLLAKTTEVGITIDTSVDTPTSLELEILWSKQLASVPPATSFYHPAVHNVVSGKVTVNPEEISWVGRAAAALPVGSYRWSFERPAEAVSYQVRIKRTGGAATEAQVWAVQVG